MPKPSMPDPGVGNQTAAVPQTIERIADGLSVLAASVLGIFMDGVG